MSKVRLLPPVLPNKVVAFGRNYAEHARELGNEVPEAPFAFFKPSTSVIGPGDEIRYPSFTEELHHEAELAVVIGRMCREVPRERVKDVIFGYTCANDITARDVQRREKQWARAKGFDGSCPLGPWVETDIDLARAGDLTVQLTVNGEQRQLGRTSEMIHPIEDLIVNITEAMTLLPGDVILTGTPAGVGPLNVGQGNRLGTVATRAAGKGVNVSVAVHAAGVRTVAVVPVDPHDPPNLSPVLISEPTKPERSSYAVFCSKKNKK